MACPSLAPHTASPPLLQVQTNGKKTPISAVSSALQDLGDETSLIRSRFQEQLNSFQGGAGGPGMPPY